MSENVNFFSFGENDITEGVIIHDGKTESSSCQKTKKWGDYVIPKKDRREFQKDKSDTDPYEDEDISSEEREEWDITDKLITKGEKVEPEDEDHVTRYIPLEDSSDYKLDKSKEIYAKSVLNFISLKIKFRKPFSAHMPANSFLTPPEVDDYMSDIIGD